MFNYLKFWLKIFLDYIFFFFPQITQSYPGVNIKKTCKASNLRKHVLLIVIYIRLIMKNSNLSFNMIWSYCN